MLSEVLCMLIPGNSCSPRSWYEHWGPGPWYPQEHHHYGPSSRADWALCVPSHHLYHLLPAYELVPVTSPVAFYLHLSSFPVSHFRRYWDQTRSNVCGLNYRQYIIFALSHIYTKSRIKMFRLWILAEFLTFILRLNYLTREYVTVNNYIFQVHHGIIIIRLKTNLKTVKKMV